MEKYLPKFTTSLPEHQRRALIQYLSFAGRDLGGVIVTGDPITKVPQVDDKLKSVDYNEFMGSVSVDLSAIFSSLNETDRQVSLLQMINKDLVASIRAEVDRIDSDVEAIRQISSGLGSSVKFESFTDFRRVVNRGTTITPDGSVILSPLQSKTSNSYSDIVSISKELLPAGMVADSVIYPRRDIRLDYLPIENSKGNSPQTGTTPRNMMVRGNTKVWKETILADYPVVHYVDNIKIDGVLLKLTIELASSRPINTLVFDPFTDRALDIMKIRWKSAAGVWSTAKNWDRSAATLSSNRTMVFLNLLGMDDVGSLEIWIRQRSYEILDVVLDGNALYQQRIWTEMNSNDYGRVTGFYTAEEVSKTTPEPDTIVRQSTAYEEATRNLFSTEETEKTFKDALGLTPREAVQVNKIEYTLGAYSIEPKYNTYPGGNTEHFMISHPDGDGYTVDVDTVTQVQLAATFEEPDVSSLEFYLLDQEGRKEIPIAPIGTRNWREHINPATSGNLAFWTLFPAVSGSMNIYRNGTEMSPTITQLDPSGSRSSYFQTNLGIHSDDVFSATYDIQHDNRAWGTQRRATVVTLTDELSPLMISESTRDNTIVNVTRNVVTLGRYPYLVGGGTLVETTMFPFTIQSAPYAIFNVPTKGQQRLLQVSTFIPYMNITFDAAPNEKWVLWVVNNVASNYNLTFLSLTTGRLMVTQTEATKGDSLVIRTITGGPGQVGSVRIDWSVIEDWPAGSFYNVYVDVKYFEPLTLADAVRWEYGKGAVIREEVMDGMLKGSDLLDPVATLKERFQISDVPILVAINERLAVDRTSYKESFQVPLDDYKLVNEYQYFVSGNRIFLNIDLEEFQGNSIDVFYWYLTKGLRVKCKMWTNRKNSSETTPVLKDYTLLLRSQL